MPLTIVAVVVSFVLSKWLAGPPTPPTVPEQATPALDRTRSNEAAVNVTDRRRGE
jgi:hypothetical protein